GLLQRLADAQRRFGDELAIDLMFASRDALRFLAQTRPLQAAEQRLDSFDELLDHPCTVAKRSSVGQPRSAAMARSRASPLVTTGRATASSSGRSLIESL